MKNFKNFTKLNETLTKSYSKELVVKYLSTLLDKDEYWVDDTELQIVANEKNYKHITEIYNRITKLYNWYYVDTTYDMGDEPGITRQEEIDSLVKDSSDFLEGDEFELHLNFKPYFTEKVIDVPEELYHYTNKEFIEKIKKQGLIPSYKEDVTETEYNPERIYFYTSFIDAQDSLFTTDKKFIITISTKDLDIDFYKDYQNKKSLFTYDNIHPKNIIEIDDIENIEKNLDKYKI